MIWQKIVTRVHNRKVNSFVRSCAPASRPYTVNCIELNSDDMIYGVCTLYLFAATSDVCECTTEERKSKIATSTHTKTDDFEHKDAKQMKVKVNIRHWWRDTGTQNKLTVGSWLCPLFSCVAYCLYVYLFQAKEKDPICNLISSKQYHLIFQVTSHNVRA